MSLPYMATAVAEAAGGGARPRHHAAADRHADEHHYEERAPGSSLLGEEESQWTLEHDSGRRAFDELSCEPTSPLDGCLPCTADESTEQYCSVSGYRQEVRCISDNSTDSGREARGPFLAYHSCLQRESDLHGLARFEFLMVCLLGASLSVVGGGSGGWIVSSTTASSSIYATEERSFGLLGELSLRLEALEVCSNHHSIARHIGHEQTRACSSYFS
eukprot:CAMPEP_0185311120 /NCGR_PEP_ID=MMETSP1363-20130426/25768_1 /TAXON_ID=38817 /ORGANISM="Gephyrocapsa oceanica, Strain RCC1303" /LENGTH=216 /DNA_ID=CAMNT_0027908721 /DNA_START=68 /DNA_END=715 /DNA_ORIENTATION=-